MACNRAVHRIRHVWSCAVVFELGAGYKSIVAYEYGKPLIGIGVRRSKTRYQGFSGVDDFPWPGDSAGNDPPLAELNGDLRYATAPRIWRYVSPLSFADVLCSLRYHLSSGAVLFSP